MIFSHKFRYVYFAIPKTASSSIVDILTREYDGHFWGKSDKHENLLPTIIGDYFCFASVRNPYQRGISGYNYLNRKRDIPLELSICKDRFHLISMVKYLSLPLQIRRFVTINDNTTVFISPLSSGFLLPRIDRFVFVESLERDFNDLPFVLRQHRMPHLNSSIKDAGSHEEILDFVQKNHREDFDRFGYEI